MFDKIIDRRNTRSVKHDKLQDFFGADNLIPLWVADMDFATPDFIRKAVLHDFAHDAWGYTFENPRWRPAIVNWLGRRHNWPIQPEWLTFIPGIVKGIGYAVNILTQPGDAVIIQSPVYHPFRLVPEHLGRRIVYNPLITLPDGTLEMDLDALDKLDTDASLLILSNPHNPVGKVWSRDTLERLAEICHRRGITVISDEIHCDMVLPGRPAHTPFASVSPQAADITITFGSPSKAFNMPGLATSYAIVSNPELRERFYGGMEAGEFNAPALGQQAAVVAAYEEGETWLAEMLQYISDNVDFVDSYCREHIPAIKVVRPDASFLVWLDCRELGLDPEALARLFVEDARLALNTGTTFGAPGYMRLNIGTPRAILEEALSRLSTAIANKN